jgi:predicted nucleic acid-binding Zn ribbon protein
MESIGGLLPRLLRDLGLEESVAGWRAVQEWADAVGDHVARHTRAVGFRDGTLHVEVEGSAWMHELMFLKRDLIRNIHRHLGSDHVRDVRFTLPRGGTFR